MFLEIYDVSLESKVKLALNNLNIKSFEKFELTRQAINNHLHGIAKFVT